MLHFLLIVIAVLVIWRMLGPLAKAWTLLGGFVLLLAVVGGLLAFAGLCIYGLTGHENTGWGIALSMLAGVVGLPAVVMLASYMGEDRPRQLHGMEKVHAERRRLGYKD